MYIHDEAVDVPINITGLDLDNYTFTLPADLHYLELSYLFFVDEEGQQVTPSAGTVIFEVCYDGNNWVEADGGLFKASSLPDYPPFYIGRAKSVRIVLNGIIGASGLKASVLQSNGPQQYPKDMYTSDARGFRRLRVDVGQTSLFEGREFRIVRKVSIPAGTPLVFKFESPIDFMLAEQQISCSEGDIEYWAWRDTQGVASGTFNTPVPVIPKNTSSKFREYDGQRYALQIEVHTGGDFTPTDPNAYVDYDRAKTSGATAQQLSVSGGDGSARYLSAGTYYLVLISLSGTSKGRFAIAGEERP